MLNFQFPIEMLHLSEFIILSLLNRIIRVTQTHSPIIYEKHGHVLCPFVCADGVRACNIKITVSEMV